MHAPGAHESTRASADHIPGLLPPAVLVLGGAVASLLAGLLHPDREPANQHAAVFAEYAASATWTAVHLGQFIGMGLLVAGILGVLDALGADAAPPAHAWLRRLAARVAVVALGLYAMLQAVDGVALKQAVDAWAAAGAPDKAPRFAAAETVRWLEWGARSYQSLVFRLTLLLTGATVLAARRPLRFVGVAMLGSGLAYLAQGWIIGVEGFSNTNSLPTLAGYGFILAWSLGLLYTAYRGARATPRGVGRLQPDRLAAPR